MIQIPEESAHLPVAQRLRRAQAEFDAAAAAYAQAVGETAREEAGRPLAVAHDALKAAEAAFDAETGEPKPLELTPPVQEQLERLFPPEQHAEVIALLERECGRKLPFCRDGTPEDVEFIRLCVLLLSKRNVDRLKEWIDTAQCDCREVITPGRRLLNRWHAKQARNP